MAQRKAAREAELVGERAAAAALAESLVALKVLVAATAHARLRWTPVDQPPSHFLCDVVCTMSEGALDETPDEARHAHSHARTAVSLMYAIGVS